MRLNALGMRTVDLSDDDVTTSHLRHLTGGSPLRVESERLFQFVFPEKPGSLRAFLSTVAQQHNISLVRTHLSLSSPSLHTTLGTTHQLRHQCGSADRGFLPPSLSLCLVQFHYRNTGERQGKVLVGVQISEADMPAFHENAASLKDLGFDYTEQTDGPWRSLLENV
jgi:threonine dehydratase